MAFPPMGIGLEVDMETGEPVAVEQLTRQAQREEARTRRLEQSQRLVDDLSGQGGEVCKLAAQQLARRIEELIAADPEARALRSLLETVGGVVAYGERLAEEQLQGLTARFA